MLGTQILIHIIMVFSLTSILSNARTPNKSSESSNHFQRWFNLLFFKLFLLSSIHFQLDNCFNLQTSDRITPYTGWYKQLLIYMASIYHKQLLIYMASIYHKQLLIYMVSIYHKQLMHILYQQFKFKQKCKCGIRKRKERYLETKGYIGAK